MQYAEFSKAIGNIQQNSSAQFVGFIDHTIEHSVYFIISYHKIVVRTFIHISKIFGKIQPYLSFTDLTSAVNQLADKSFLIILPIFYFLLYTAYFLLHTTCCLPAYLSTIRSIIPLVEAAGTREIRTTLPPLDFT